MTCKKCGVEMCYPELAKVRPKTKSIILHCTFCGWRFRTKKFSRVKWAIKMGKQIRKDFGI